MTPLVDAVVKKFPHAGQLEELARNLEAERDQLREQNKELVEIVRLIAEISCDSALMSQSPRQRVVAQDIPVNLIYAARAVLAKMRP